MPAASPQPPKLKRAPRPIKLEDRKLRVVIYGDPGTGKTTLAAEFPKPLVIDTDFGLVSVAYKADGKDVGESWTPDGYRDLEALTAFIRGKVRAGDYETIVIDSIDTLCEMLLDELTSEHAKADTHGKRPLLMESIPEQIEFLGNRHQVRTFLRELAGMGCHVVVTASKRMVGDPVPNKAVPDVAPSIVSVLGKWPDIIGELQANVTSKHLPEGEHRLLITKTSPARVAKTRFPEQEPWIVEPTFDKLWGPLRDAIAKRKSAEKAE